MKRQSQCNALPWNQSGTSDGHHLQIAHSLCGTSRNQYLFTHA